MTRRRGGLVAAILLSGVVGGVFAFATRYVALLPAAFLGLIGVTSIGALLAVRDLSRRNAIVLVGLAGASIGAVVAFVGMPMFVHL